MTEQKRSRGLMRLNLSQKPKLIALMLLLLGGILVVKYTARPSPAQSVTVTLSGRSHLTSLSFTPCWLEGFREQVLCTSYEVYENRDSHTGRRIPLHIAVLPALKNRVAPDALFALAGGPGQAATSFGAFADTVFQKVRAERDIVLVDQRGTGRSNPLRCEMEMDGIPLSVQKVSPSEKARECLAKLDADPRYYSSFAFAGDLDEVREALGYSQIDLWGGSYGTRAALVYMKLYPDRVRTAVLDGVAPYTNKLPLYEARDAQRSLNLVFERCRQDKECRTAFPDVRERFETLLSKLEKSPARVRVHNPRTGDATEITVTREDFASGMRALLYVPAFDQLIPLVIKNASDGNFEPLVALAKEMSRDSSETMSIGLTFSVLCSEDMARITPQEERLATSGTFLRDGSFKLFSEVCSLWPRAQLPPHFDAQPELQTPTLLLSGELDPVTPPTWAEQAAAHLPNSLQVVVPGAAHGVSAYGCMPDVIASFVKRGVVSGLDTSCAARELQSQFFTSATGTTP
jgi:pimeloyl-ACP methyl ester carboxylesterase